MFQSWRKIQPIETLSGKNNLLVTLVSFCSVMKLHLQRSHRAGVSSSHDSLKTYAGSDRMSNLRAVARDAVLAGACLLYTSDAADE